MEITVKIEKRNDNLKERRQAAGLSQSQLAKLAGVGVRVYQNYEQGVRDVSKAQLSTLLRICKALNCKLLGHCNRRGNRGAFEGIRTITPRNKWRGGYGCPFFFYAEGYIMARRFKHLTKTDRLRMEAAAQGRKKGRKRSPKISASTSPPYTGRKSADSMSTAIVTGRRRSDTART